MKVVNATWDENVTGLRTCEVVFERNDTFQTYFDANVEKDYNFSVVKVPTGNLHLIHQLEEVGYRYLENQFRISFDSSALDVINAAWTRVLNGFTCYIINKPEELELIKNGVREDMFRTDRFSLDPLFSESDIPSKRFINWIEEMFYRGGTQFYSIERNGKGMGFFSLKPITRFTCSCPIAGIYNNFKSSGYVYGLAWFWLQKARELGYRKLITSISTNNRIFLSSFSRIFYFRIDEILIVMRKQTGQG